MGNVFYPEEIAEKIGGTAKKKEIKARERLGEKEIARKQKLDIIRLKTERKLALKQFGSKQKRFSKLLKFKIAPQLTKEQEMLQELFGSNPSWGTGENLPKFDNVLNSGEGLINSGDDESETAQLFGLKRRNII